MTERYDSTAARHYAAFRPPLHALILDRLMDANESFGVGLDVGCGTGYSAVALTKYCERVYGLDSSQSMLEAAQKHPQITYLYGSSESLNQLPVQAFDIVTFAGSLFYTKSDSLRSELLRVCPPGGTILVYDFEILLNEVMTAVGIDIPVGTSNYDHRVNFSSWAEFMTETSGAERVRLEVTENQMAHLLLSDSNHYDGFLKRFPNGDPYEPLVDWLKNSARAVHLDADIYFTRYRVLGG